MPNLDPNLVLARCPHCNVDSPNLGKIWHTESYDHAGGNLRRWGIYRCGRCGSLVVAAAAQFGSPVSEIYPSSEQVDEDLPAKARAFLEQAILSMNAPAGALMLAASSVDAMLKAKGLMEGSLYARIEKAAATNLITGEMSKWAHEVRLDANDQRHADDAAPLPSSGDAKRAIDFAKALGMFMFTLPAKVSRGINQAKGK